MEMPKAKWLNWYSWFIIMVSSLETGVLVSSRLLEKVTLSAFQLYDTYFGLYQQRNYYPPPAGGMPNWANQSYKEIYEAK
jgi:hypothetical protein